MRQLKGCVAVAALLSAAACSALERETATGQEPGRSPTRQEPTSSGSGRVSLETADAWDVSARLGVLTMPAYTGSDDYQLWAVPEVSLRYGEFFFSFFEGTGYNVLNNGTWRAGPVVKYQFGRDEDGDNPTRIGGRVTDDLRGLGDVDDTLEVGGFVEYRNGSFVGKLEVRQGLGGHEGVIGGLELKRQQMVNLFGQQGFLSVGPELTLADSTYNRSYFGVSPAQSASSRLAPYDAGDEFLSVGVGVALALPLTRRVSLTGLGRYSRLLGNAAESSLVRERGSEDQFMGGLFLSYQF
ncbi:MAG: MipA/OmpV family protein [Planctomycetota bacterium]